MLRTRERERERRGEVLLFERLVGTKVVDNIMMMMIIIIKCLCRH